MACVFSWFSLISDAQDLQPFLRQEIRKADAAMEMAAVGPPAHSGRPAFYPEEMVAPEPPATPGLWVLKQLVETEGMFFSRLLFCQWTECVRRGPRARGKERGAPGRGPLGEGAGDGQRSEGVSNSSLSTQCVHPGIPGTFINHAGFRQEPRCHPPGQDAVVLVECSPTPPPAKKGLPCAERHCPSGREAARTAAQGGPLQSFVYLVTPGCSGAPPRHRARTPPHSFQTQSHHIQCDFGRLLIST